MSANLENLAVAVRLEKVSFPSSPKDGQCQRMFRLSPLALIHMLARQCSKSIKLDFRSMWTEIFQMYKLDFEKAEEPEVNCQHLLDHRKSKGIPEKHLLLLHWLHSRLWLCDFRKLWKIFQEMGKPDYLTCLLRNLYAGQEATVSTGHGTMNWLEQWTG